MRTRTVIPLVFLTIMLATVGGLLRAGVTGQIEGLITDRDTGKPVVGASVFIVGTNRGALTDFEGRYIITQVEPGTYTLKITHVSFAEATVTDVVVTVGDSVCVDAILEGKSAETNRITVEAKKDILHLSEVSSLPSPAHSKADVAACISRIGRSEEESAWPPAHGGTAIVNGEAFDAMFFEHYGVNPFIDTEDDHLSTFAIDVDDASYVMTRSYLNRGAVPPKDAVRTEEFLNHFDYNYDPPRHAPFDVYLEGAPSRFGENYHMLKIGIKGLKIDPKNRKPANLVFVIDISGSMQREDRLTLVKKALRLLVDELRPDDRVGIVVYGSTGRIHMQPTSADRRFDIIRAIEQLAPGGSTNAEEGLRLGYDMAQRCFEVGRINRIILCSDGVANVGVTKAEDLLKWIKGYADRGITLTTVGFGMGNFNDILMEKLGNKGNGHYAYVDNLPEARRVFVENLTGVLQVIARDVKIQVDFNPAVVSRYRLLGYENRDVADDKFRDDKEDGGEIGSGHSVTALYEIKFNKEAASGDVGTIFIRYKDPDGLEVTEIKRPIARKVFRSGFEQASVEFKLASAAAEFAELMRGSYWARESSLTEVLGLVKSISQETESRDVIELMDLVAKAENYQQQLAER